MHIGFNVGLGLFVLAASGSVCLAADASKDLAPLPAAKSLWSHAPYEDGNCANCHERKDERSPGKIVQPINELCFSCHETSKHFEKAHANGAANSSCTSCHNPHNGSDRRLLKLARK